MILNKRHLGKLLTGAGAAAIILSQLAVSDHALAKEGAEGVIRAHGTSLMGTLKYGPDFKHFDYVNTDAPKGGLVKMSTRGAFDSFNPFIVKGDPAIGASLIYDTLMIGTLDEPGAEYGLLAEWSEWPKDYSWVKFKLRDQARFHDGEPVKVEDVIFSFDILTTKGHPGYKAYYQNVVKATDLGDGVVRFDFDEKNNKELPHIVGQLPILPKHYWADKDFDESSLEKPLGSGAYRFGDFEANRFLEYERVADYWGADLPVNVGQDNFGAIRYEYYKDAGAVMDSFKSGGTYFRAEYSSKSWAQDYNFPAVKDGRVVRETVETEAPKTTQTFAFNLRNPKFQDKRVREAIAMAFDFEWTNDALFYGQYARPYSYFQGTPDLMATGVPKGLELEMLKEHEDALPEELFTEPFANHKTDGSGRPDRRALRRGRSLFTEAGYSMEDGVLVNEKGEPFTLEFLSAQKLQERILSPFVSNLKRFGIDASIRFVDIPQYTKRLDEYDFDMVIGGVSNSASPGNEQRGYWGSKDANTSGGRNLNGVQNPVVDDLIDKIIFAENREALAAASRALDRVLLWEHYNVLELYTPYERIAYWKDKVQGPENFPSQSYGFPTIWWSPEAED